MEFYIVALVYAALGCVAGFAAGLLGVGGGLIIVPVLVVVFNILDIAQLNAMYLAIGTSLATISVTSISSTIAHHKHRAVEWAIVKRFAPGITVGAIVGALIATGITNDALKRTFAVFELLIAIQVWFEIQPSSSGRLPGVIMLSIVGVGIGTVSSLIGIGGGTMTVPYLTWSKMAIHRAVATSAACGVPIAVVGSVSYWLLGILNNNNELDSGFVFWPAFLVIAFFSWLAAPLGAHVSHLLPRIVLRRIFSIVLMFLGIFMLLY